MHRLFATFNGASKEKECRFKQARSLKEKKKLQRLKGKILSQNAFELKTLIPMFYLPEEEQREREAGYHSKKAGNDGFIKKILTWLEENGNGNAEYHGDIKVLVLVVHLYV